MLYFDTIDGFKSPNMSINRSLLGLASRTGPDPKAAIYAYHILSLHKEFASQNFWIREIRVDPTFVVSRTLQMLETRKLTYAKPM